METIQKIVAQLPVEPQSPPAFMSRARILIIDDTPANIRLLTETLEPRGYEILAAPSGEPG